LRFIQAILPFFRSSKVKRPNMFDVGAFWYKSLTMTYFHRCTSTIIGAKAFHGPVRDGKAWDHLAMVVKRKGLRFKGFGLEAPMR
tara:strand:+ start:1095 stop:1349 length:255 start_codon:yes stop_codon:yes gene_type:complete